MPYRACVATRALLDMWGGKANQGIRKAVGGLELGHPRVSRLHSCLQGQPPVGTHCRCSCGSLLVAAGKEASDLWAAVLSQMHRCSGRFTMHCGPASEFNIGGAHNSCTFYSNPWMLIVLFCANAMGGATVHHTMAVTSLYNTCGGGTESAING